MFYTNVNYRENIVVVKLKVGNGMNIHVYLETFLQ